MIRVLIIDDETLARTRVRLLLEQREDVEILGECRNGKQAVEEIVKHQPDLIFLDIQMKGMTGFDVIDAIPEGKLPLTIFATAYDEYAMKAFNVFAFDYLLKPFKEERFFQSLDNAIVNLRQKEQESYTLQLRELVASLREKQKPKQEPLALKQGSKISLVNMTDICYIEASGYYIEVHTVEKKRLLLRESMTNMLEQLSAPSFLRVHRSTIINMDYLSEVQHTGAGDVVTKMKDGKTFRVSKSYKEELFGRLRL